jgi:hypothetical protein
LTSSSLNGLMTAVMSFMTGVPSVSCTDDRPPRFHRTCRRVSAA